MHAVNFDRRQIDCQWGSKCHTCVRHSNNANWTKMTQNICEMQGICFARNMWWARATRSEATNPTGSEWQSMRGSAIFAHPVPSESESIRSTSVFVLCVAIGAMSTFAAAAMGQFISNHNHIIKNTEHEHIWGTAMKHCRIILMRHVCAIMSAHAHKQSICIPQHTNIVWQSRDKSSVFNQRSSQRCYYQNMVLSTRDYR